MNISAIGPNFQGRREDMIDAAINLDDNSLRKIAYIQTANSSKEKKNRRITNALFYSAPLAAGLGAAVFKNDISTKIFSKNLTGVAGRAAKGLKVAALWTAGLAAIDTLGFIKNKIAQKSPKVRKFDREHPFMSFGASIAAGLGALALVNYGAGKLAAKKAPKILQKGTEKVARFLNTNKFITGMKTKALNVLNKTPEAVKNIGSTVLSWAPTALLFGGLFNSIDGANAQNREFVKNYNNLKEQQKVLAKIRLAQLATENDFLMQDAQNREDMKIINDNLADLPDEVVEKIETLHQDEEV